MTRKWAAAAILRIEAQAAAVAAAAALQLEVAELTMEWSNWQFCQWHMGQYVHNTDKSVQLHYHTSLPLRPECMYKVQTSIYNTRYKQVYTNVNTYITAHRMERQCIYTNTHAFTCMFVYILVQTMYIPRTYMACTISRFYEHLFQEIQKWYDPGLNPWSCAY